MITPMNKYHFLVYHKDYLSFLEGLKKVGVVDIDIREELPEDLVVADTARLKEIQHTINFLSLHKSSEDEGEACSLEDLQEKHTEYEQLINRKEMLHNDRNNLEPWGDFDKTRIAKLAQAGIGMSFFRVPTSKFDKEWTEDYTIEKVEDSGLSTYFIIFHSPENLPDINADKVEFPEATLQAIRQSLKETEQKIEEIETYFATHSVASIAALKKEAEETEKRIHFDKVKAGNKKAAEGTIVVIEGWAPTNEEENINEYVSKQQVYHTVEKPTPEETPEIPIKLKNSWYSSLFEPISKLYMLPTYKELDMTPFLAPFFMLFFGFCLGDVGYGFILLLPLLYFAVKGNKAVRPFAQLGSFLMFSAMLFGALTGSVFGVSLADQDIPALQELKAFFFDSNKMMALALCFGAIQLLVGMFLKGINRANMFGFKHSITPFSWFFLFFASAVNGLVTEVITPSIEFANPVYMVMLCLSFVGILFFNTPGKNILLNFGAGLWDSYNMIIGTIGDLLSYIRLFALGLASAMLGGAFNQVALMTLDINGYGLEYLFMIIILLIGHGLNIFTAVLGSFVHPLRLTFVEFYKSAGFQGGGRKYYPLKN